MNVPDLVPGLGQETAAERARLLQNVRGGLENRPPDATALLRGDGGNLALRDMVSLTVVPALLLLHRFCAFPDDALRTLTTSQVMQVDAAAQDFFRAVDRVRGFSSISDTHNTLDSVAGGAGRAAALLAAVLSPIVALLDVGELARARGTLDEEALALAAMRDDANAKIGLLWSETNQVLVDATAARKQATAALQTVRDAAAESGVLVYIESFREAADIHEGSAHRAREWAVIWAVALGGWALIALFAPFPEAVGWAAAQKSAAKVVLTSVFTFGLVWCTRSFRAHQHNAIVARHRQRALTTFERFVAAAKADDATKHAVLTAAMQTAFAPQATGYSDVDMPAPTVTNVVDLAKLAAPAARP